RSHRPSRQRPEVPHRPALLLTPTAICDAPSAPPPVTVVGRRCEGLPVIVSQLTIAPVKGMRLQRSTEIQLGRHGVTGDREFLIVDDDGKLLLTARNPGLLRIEPSWEPARNLLALRFPDGSVVQDVPEPGTAAVTRLYGGRKIPGRVIPGPLSAALSDYLGRAVHLFKRAADHFGNDDHPVTLMSEASLHALAAKFAA